MVNFKNKTTIIFFKMQNKTKNECPKNITMKNKNKSVFLLLYVYIQQICIISDQNPFSLVMHDKLYNKNSCDYLEWRTS
jgi:hypothetical protein